jgi:hypothetical protein
VAAPSIQQRVAPARHDEAKTADESGAATDRQATEDGSAPFETPKLLDRAASFVSYSVGLISGVGAAKRVSAALRAGQDAIRRGLDEGPIGRPEAGG